MREARSGGRTTARQRSVRSGYRMAGILKGEVRQADLEPVGRHEQAPERHINVRHQPQRGRGHARCRRMPTSVHDPEPAGDNFAHLRRLTLWNHSPGVLKRLQPFDRGQNPLRCQVRVGTRVTRDVRPNLSNLGKRLRRPDKLGHSPSRRFASSWKMPLLRSSCARPISIFARNTRRSIASSTVALAGSSRMASTIRSRVIDEVMMPRFWR